LLKPAWPELGSRQCQASIELYQEELKKVAQEELKKVVIAVQNEDNGKENNKQ
jgi:hypothetical protein